MSTVLIRVRRSYATTLLAAEDKLPGLKSASHVADEVTAGLRKNGINITTRRDGTDRYGAGETYLVSHTSEQVNPRQVVASLKERPGVHDAEISARLIPETAPAGTTLRTNTRPLLTALPS